MNMNEFNDDLFNEDEFGEGTAEPKKLEGTDPQQLLNSNEPSVQDEDDFTTEVLRLKGITNPEKIKFEDESGAVVERPWDSLSREEQLNILAGQETEADDLDDSELELINSIRNSGMSIEEYMNSLYVPETKHYKADELSDEDLYALDLLDKVGADNITDEEIAQAIETAKQNEKLFQKTAEGLRAEYIRLQEEEEAQLTNEKLAKQEAEYKQFATSIQGEIRGLNSFAGQELQLADDDIEDLSSFILDLDESGVSSFGKAMNDPALFTRAAFWILNEDKIVEELTKQMQDNYKKGYEAAKADLSGKPRLVFNPKPTQNQMPQVDEWVDDEEW